MSSVFFLCAVNNHVQRLERDKKKLRCSFPEAPELMDKVRARNLQHHLLTGMGSTSFVITGLMKSGCGITKQDLLSPCPFRNEFAVWNYYWRGASNLFTINVQEVFMFEQALPIFTCLDKRGNVCPISGRNHILNPFIACSLPVNEVMALRGRVNSVGDRVVAADVVSSWNLELSDASLTVPVAEPVPSLILCGQWRTIGMLGHWRFLRDLFPGYPPACLNRLEFHEDQDNHWSGLLTAGKFSQQAQRIRAWAPSVIQGVADEDEQAGLRLELADSLSWLETLEAQTSWQSRVQRHKYSSRTLIQAVFFRFTLGSASKIGKAFQLALSVGIPGLDLRTFASQASLPSKTTLTRQRVPGHVLVAALAEEMAAG